MNYEYDVAIIGAGPAGSTAAYIIGKLGFNVILIDKCSFPRDKLCGGLISAKTMKLLERTFDETEDSLNKKRIINFSSNKFQFICKNKNLAKCWTKVPTHFVERTVYDKFLVDKAISSGIKFIQDEEVEKVDLDSNILVTSKRNKIIYKYLIGADGANSIVRKEFEKIGVLNKDTWLDNLGFALEVLIDKDKLPFERDMMHLHFGYIKNGYAWIFPNKNKVVIGIGGLMKDLKERNLKTIFSDFLISLGLDKKTVETSIKEMKGHPIPFGNFIERPLYKNTILIGDAAGLVNSVTGEGIYYAQRSAEIGADAIVKDHNNQGKLDEEYLNNLNLYLLPELSNIRKKRNMYFKIFNNYPLAKIVSYLMFKSVKYS
jgi:geranylgeranyl reductase family protein